MGVFEHFEQFPYTNFHDLNLDWILKVLKQFDKKLDTFVDNATVKYADPFQWAITSQYPVNTVVIDPVDGTAYISRQAVPSGIALTNSDYWTPVYKYQELADVLKKQIAGIDFGNVNVAPQNVTKYDLCWYENKLYRAQKNITTTDTVPFNDPAYMVPVTVEQAIQQIQTAGDLSRTAENIVDNVSGDYTEIAGDKSETYQNRTVMVTKDSQETVQGNKSINVTGDLAINAGKLEYGTTEESNTEYFNKVQLYDKTGTAYNVLVENDSTKKLIGRHKRFIIVGDSYAADHDHGGLAYETWYGYFKAAMGLADKDCYNASYGGAGFVGNFEGYTYLSYLQHIANDITSPDTITDIVLMGGMNDAQYSTSAIISNAETFINYCKTTYPNAAITIGMIGFSSVDDADGAARLRNLLVNVLPAYQTTANLGCRVVEINRALTYRSDLIEDNIHPTADAEKILGEAIITAYLTGCANLIRFGAPTFTVANTAWSSQTALISDCCNGIMSKIETQGDNGIQITLGEDTTIPNNGLLLGTINNASINPITDNRCVANVIYYTTTSGGNVPGMFPFVLRNNNLIIFPGTSNTINSIAITQLHFQNFIGQ